MQLIMNASNNQFALESLEGRTMMSAAPLTVAEIAINGGMQLQITGTAGNDKINVKQNANGLTVDNGSGWSATYNKSYKNILVHGGAGNDLINIDASVKTTAILYGDAGNDTLNGGSGNDSLFAGNGIDVLSAGAGNDVLVDVNSAGNDRIIGGNGEDSFWVKATDILSNVTAAETAHGDIHKISTFWGYHPAQQPTLTDNSITYKDFSTHQLFSDNGPAAADIKQGYLGDCYFLSTLSSIAKVNANVIRQSVVDLGDGTYGVQFTRNGAKLFVRVDGQLPTWYGQLAYADQGAQNSIWVSIMEKAFAEFRTNGNSYGSLEGGWMDEVYAALGKNANTLWSANNGNALLTWMQQQLAAGKSVTMAVGNVPAGAPLIGDHAYMVDAVIKDVNGNMTLRLRNPWGVDGAGNDGANDGYVTITAAQALAACMGTTAAAL